MDHVHLLACLPAKRAVSEMVRDIKANSSRWLNQEFQFRHKFQWQKGYSIFTVSHSQISGVQEYVQNQHEHHRRLSFQEEYMAMLRRHEIPFDEENLFEAENHG